MTTQPETETLFEFPCLFPIKVMGEKKHDLEGLVRKVLVDNGVDADAIEVKSRDSAAGNYVSITAKFTAENKPQLDAIYQQVSADPIVKMAL